MLYSLLVIRQVGNSPRKTVNSGRRNPLSRFSVSVGLFWFFLMHYRGKKEVSLNYRIRINELTIYPYDSVFPYWTSRMLTGQSPLTLYVNLKFTTASAKVRVFF